MRSGTGQDFLTKTAGSRVWKRVDTIIHSAVLQKINLASEFFVKWQLKENYGQFNKKYWLVSLVVVRKNAAHGFGHIPDEMKCVKSCQGGGKIPQVQKSSAGGKKQTGQPRRRRRLSFLKNTFARKMPWLISDTGVNWGMLTTWIWIIMAPIISSWKYVSIRRAVTALQSLSIILDRRGRRMVMNEDIAQSILTFSQAYVLIEYIFTVVVVVIARWSRRETSYFRALIATKNSLCGLSSTSVLMRPGTSIHPRKPEQLIWKHNVRLSTLELFWGIPHSALDLHRERG